MSSSAIATSGPPPRAGGFTVPLVPEGLPTPGELRSQTVVSGGVQRRFVVYLPARYDATRALPAVINLHGSTSYPEEQMAISAMATAADRFGFAILAPEALDRAWNVPTDATRADDVRLIDDVLEATARLVPLDHARIHATGFSGGGRMACLLAGRLSAALAGIAPVSGVRFPADHPPSRPMPVVAFHGVADPVNPYEGGGPAYWQTGVVHAVTAWVQHNRSEGVETSRPAPSVTCVAYGTGQRLVRLYRIEGLGHQWPGSPVDIGAPFGPPNRELSATDVMFEFFAGLGSGSREREADA